MKKLSKLKLNHLNKVELETRQMNALKGGVVAKCGCVCVCDYYHPGGENTYTEVNGDYNSQGR
jgi:natural product precursor